jgi:hypothetical protein
MIAMIENDHLVTFAASGRIGYFMIVPDNVMVLPEVELFKTGNPKTHESPVRIDQGNLTITNKNLSFAGSMEKISFTLTQVTRVQPYENAIDIYEKGQKEGYKFVWGNAIKMKLIEIPGDDGRIKPLTARMVAQYIINERNRVGNLIRSK